VRTRPHRTPLSIKILVVVWSLIGLLQLATNSRIPASGITLWWLTTLSAALGFVTYQAIALWRLSRWPIVLQSISFGLILQNRHQAGFDWRAHYPLLGIFVFVIPTALYFALVLPHWRKTNWSLFGRPYSPPENQVEVFA
jgi:hypothetical protein